MWWTFCGKSGIHFGSGSRLGDHQNARTPVTRRPPADSKAARRPPARQRGLFPRFPSRRAVPTSTRRFPLTCFCFALTRRSLLLVQRLWLVSLWVGGRLLGSYPVWPFPVFHHPWRMKFLYGARRAFSQLLVASSSVWGGTSGIPPEQRRWSRNNFSRAG
jgi:hypothetical protein